MIDVRRVAVIGGGNIGTQFACICAAKGYDVVVVSSKPDKYDGILEILDEEGNATSGKVARVTSHIGEAVESSDFVFVTYPAFRFKQLSEEMLPFVRPGLFVCIVPGTGGAEFAFHKSVIEAGGVLCGLQRVPSVARLEKYGKRVRCEGLRHQLGLAAIPGKYTTDVSEFMESLWLIPCVALPNYLSVTLTPSNPILHTARLRTLFADYTDGMTYDRNPLFYGEWTDESSALLLACDEELQEICRNLDELDLTGVCPLKQHYESCTVPELTAKMRNIKSLHTLLSPMKMASKGWVPDFNSRYFTADFPFGLAIIEQIACLNGTDVPNIADTMSWYCNVSGNITRLELGEYGIFSLDDLYGIYM